MTDRPAVRTPQGVLRGTAEGGVAAYRGVPYAVAGRFAAPRDAPGWTGVRDASAPGPAAPQPPSRLAAVTGPGGGLAQSEDCLTVNVWTPDLHGEGGTGLPVVVWLHGGGFSSGSGGEDFYAGAQLAAHGRMVVVTVNYRLGAFGYAHLGPEAAAVNPGLLDQLAALRWVRASAPAFGGDPARVTLAGQSAGALSALALLAHPAGRGLFARAVLQSPPAGVAPFAPEQAAARTRRLAELAETSPRPPASAAPPHPAPGADAGPVGPASSGGSGVPGPYPLPGGQGPPGAGAGSSGGSGVPGPYPAGSAALAARLRSAAVPVLLRAQQDLAREQDEPLSVTPVLQLVAAGGLPRDLVGAARTDVPLLVGTARDEARAFFPGEPGGVVADVTARSFTDGTLRLAARAATAYVYRFDWAPPGSPLGPCHCIELPFLFGADRPAWRAAPVLAGADPAELRRLTAEVQGAWAAFVHTGDPGWPAYPQVRSFG
ncbi:carboxylesterase family protein [Streptomyces sp. NRRL F-5123]|uniref:carboxylesterase family protein n=1 Tax=Streptomyces sp. NRRL F-5123 TaxID=1463856 RepID=UPI0004E27883|nr:carboxylesterase family protein [Streptomyces sp. NRRL F-5123]